MLTYLRTGLHLGFFPDGDDDEAMHEVRHGGELELLTQDEFAAWLLPAEMLQDAGATRHRLIERGLLAELDDADPAPFASSYRMAPLLLGLGQSMFTPGAFAIGLPGREILSVAPATFDAWAASAICESIAQACASDAVLATLVQDLPRLVSADAVYLDRAQRT